MIFKRKAYQKMLDWKHLSNGSTALLIEGARRVGKTTIVKEFAANEYASSLYIDFSNADRDVLETFREHRGDLDTLFRILQLYFNVVLTKRQSVVIFDEVQAFPPARELIKHLVADGRYDYIETGSLISIKKNVKDIVIPSEEERLTLFPLDFEEYLWAAENKELSDAIIDSYQSVRALPDAIHKKAKRLFDEYMLVGGMPQPVEAYLQDKDFIRCDKIKQMILSLYSDDMEKIGGADGRRAYSIFKEVPGQLSNENKRFKFSVLDDSARYRNYESALRWLEDAHLVNICRKCNDPNVGFALTEDSSSLKCYLADTGLLVSLAFSDGPLSAEVYKSIQMGNVSINRGMITENVVAQQLRSSGHSLFYYEWREEADKASSKSRRREIDFLTIQKYANAAGKPRISPIEVKSGRTYSTVSLNEFAARFKKRVGTQYVLHPRQFKKEGNRVELPLYMSFCL